MFFAGRRPRIFAHRGLATDVRENTLRAFSAALACGDVYVETDVHCSRDGIAILSHDPDLTDSGGRSWRISGLTLAELHAIDVGDGQSLATLTEALTRFPEARFNIDVKSDPAVGPMVRAVMQADAIERVLVTSFDDRRRARTVRLLTAACIEASGSSSPLILTSASARLSAIAVVSAAFGLTALTRFLLRSVQAVQLPERYRGLIVLTRRRVQTFRRAGVEVHVWTVNDPTDMQRLAAWGVDGIITDRADLAVSILRDYP